MIKEVLDLDIVTLRSTDNNFKKEFPVIRMKILQIADYYHSGDGHPMNNITERLESRGHGVKVYTSTLSVTPEGDKDSPDVETLRFRGFEIGGKVVYLGIILKLLLQRNPDVIHSWVSGFFSTFVTGYLKKVKGYPLVVTPDFDIAGSDPSLLKKPYFWLYRKIPTDMADLVLAFTQQEKEHLNKRFGIKKEKIKVLPIGIDIEKLSSEPSRNVREELGLEDKFIVLNVSYMVPKKNLEMVIEAISRIDSDDIVFLHVGKVIDSDYKNSLVKLTEDLELTDKVKFIDQVDQDGLYDILKIADVFVQAGFKESYAIPIIEAMAAGIPVITTKVGIAYDVIENGETGFNITNEKDLAQKIELLKQDLELKKKIGENCREVAKEYDWEIIVDRLEEFYNSLIGNSA